MATTELLSPAATVEFLGGLTKAKTLANWRSARSGPAFLKIGGRILYELSELQRYRDSCRRLTRGATSDARAEQRPKDCRDNVREVGRTAA